MSVKKICIVTGANAGIGKQAAIQIAEKGYHVILACRNRARGEQTVSELKKLYPDISIELQLIDLGLQSSIMEFADSFNKKYEHLDVLIHNAAIFNVTQKNRELTAEGVETVWATNHIGPVLLTDLLLDRLKKSENGRILTVSSKGLLAKPLMKVNINDVEFKYRPFNIVNAYYQSKIAQIIYTYSLTEKLKETNITANCIRVTAVKIDISRHPDLSPFMKWVYSIKAKNSLSPEKMAETYTDLAVSSRYEKISGKYFDENSNEVNPSAYCRKRENIDAVMSLTESYISELRVK